MVKIVHRFRHLGRILFGGEWEGVDKSSVKR